MSDHADESGDQAQRALSALHKLKRGKGTADIHALKRLSADERQALGISTVSSAELERVRHRLNQSAGELPERDTREVLLMALNLDGRQGDWTRRHSDFAAEVDRSPRTICRRTNDALLLLAANLTDRQSPRVSGDALQTLRGMLRRHRIVTAVEDDATVRVMRDSVDVIETRRVRANADGVEHFVVGKTLPREGTVVRSRTEEGAKLVEVERPNEHYVVELIRFPKPLAAGEEHRFVMTHRTENMAPMYTVTPVHRVRRLIVRVQFVDIPPTRIWKVDGIAPGMLRTSHPDRIFETGGDEYAMDVDAFGYAEVAFENLIPGDSYGVVWFEPSKEHDG